jgi:tRNA G46 methylase TrmB
MENKARSVISNQTSIHEDLEQILVRHKQSTFKRPIAEHTRQAFLTIIKWLENWEGDVVLDSCCGVGESTLNIAHKYPHAKIIGVDKSIARLDKHKSYKVKQNQEDESNYRVIQADLNDFWRLLADYISANKPLWRIKKHFILYPNPYPKKAQIGKRWYASALMPYIIELCDNIEVRSNWKLYVQEFLFAAQFYGLQGQISELGCELAKSPEKSQLQERYRAITPFERKYLDANQICFKLVILPSGCDKL